MPTGTDPRATLRASVERTSALLSLITDGQQPVLGCNWTAGEVGAHLVVTLQTYADAAGNSFDRISPYIAKTGNFRERLSFLTEGTLKLVSERDPWALSRLLVRAAAAFLDSISERDHAVSIRAPWYGPHVRLSEELALSLLIGEQLVHGHDLAITIGHPWPISNDDASHVIPIVIAMIPFLNNNVASADRIRYGIRLVDGHHFDIVFDDGAVEVATPAATADVELALSPADFVLAIYGRHSLQTLAAGGRLRSLGGRQGRIDLQDRLVSP